MLQKLNCEALLAKAYKAAYSSKEDKEDTELPESSSWGKKDDCQNWLKELCISLQNDDFLKALLIGTEEQLCKTYTPELKWLRFYLGELRSRDAKEQKLANELIKNFISYSMMDSDTKHSLYYKMGVRVCPYCNRQFIDSFGDEELYTGELDHLKPKSEYQLFSLSLWNLVPSCKVCNQAFKRDMVLNILNLWNESFHDLVEGTDEKCCIPTLIYPKDIVSELDVRCGITEDFDMKWTISPNLKDEDKIERLKTSITAFQLDALYSAHSYEIQQMLKLCHNYSPEYIAELNRMISEHDSKEKLGKLPPEKKKYPHTLLSGPDLRRYNEADFSKHILSKLSTDIAEGDFIITENTLSKAAVP